MQSRTRNHFGKIAMLTILAVCVSSFLIYLSEKKSLDVEFLAEDAFFEIAGETITLPFIAVSYQPVTFDLNPRRNDVSVDEHQARMREMAGDPSSPKGSESLTLYLEVYGHFGERLMSSKICPLLSREWARNICRNQRPGQLANVPRRLRLIDRERASQLLARSLTVGMERMSDQIASMRFEPGRPEIGCDKATKFCTAVVPITSRLLAVWTVWDAENKSESSLEMARRQGRAIYQLVRHGFGENEDFDAIVS